MICMLLYIAPFQKAWRFTVMAIGDMYVLDLKQSFLGQPLHNIFTYEASGTASSFALCQAFIDQVLTAVLRPIQCSQIVSVSVAAYNLGIPEDIFEITVGANGGITAEMLPVFNAINFTFKSGSRGIRPGSKRIAGIPETVQLDGTINDASYITALNALRVQFGEDLEGGD